jgi:prevent-host-death family protein
MQTANVHEAKSNLSKLLDAARAGEEVVITRNNERFTLVKVATSDRMSMFGWFGDVWSFDEAAFSSADGELAELLIEGE